MDIGTVTVLWIVSAIMLIAALTFTFMQRNASTESKHFYYASSFITITAATLYFAMASGSGRIIQPGGHVFLFGRYIDWAITTPLLLLDLALVGLPRFPGRSALLAWLMGADIYMIVTGFVAAALRSEYRWAWFVISSVAFLVILYIIVGQLGPIARRRDPVVAQHFRTLSTMLLALWFCYPIVWALGTEGFGVFSTFVATVLYGILDVLAKVVYGFILLRNRNVLDHVEETGDTHTVTTEGVPGTAKVMP